MNRSSGAAATQPVEQVRFHVEVRKQQRILEHVADAALLGRQVDALRGIEQDPVVDADDAARRRA